MDAGKLAKIHRTLPGKQNNESWSCEAVILSSYKFLWCTAELGSSNFAFPLVRE